MPWISPRESSLADCRTPVVYAINDIRDCHTMHRIASSSQSQAPRERPMQQPEVDLQALADDSTENGSASLQAKQADPAACWVEEYAASGVNKDGLDPCGA
jgi:hypothetical protein